MGDIKTKSINAVIWSAFDKFGQQGITFILGLVIARLLFPSDYGLIAMLAIFIAIPDMVVQSGFGAALIQRKSVDDTDFSTVFYFNIVVGISLYFALYLSAPLIAAFYEEPQLVILTRVVGLGIVISSFAVIQKTILTKEIDFKTQAKVNISAIIPAGIIGIVFAYYGYGVWAIVFKSLSRQFFITLFLWIFNKWRPQLVFSMRSLKSLFGFGSKLFLNNLINTVFTRIQLIVIGKVYDAASLGFYTRAQQFKNMPTNSITQIINRVSFPIFSSIQDNNALILSGYRKVIKMAAFVNFPAMLGLIIISEPLIRLLLTEKWLPAVPFLQIMCIGGLLAPMQSIALNVIIAKGNSGLYLKLGLLKKALYLITILITFRFGVMAIIYGFTILSFLSFYINFYFTGKKLNFTFKNQLIDLFPYFIIALVTAVFMYISGYFFSHSDILKLVVQSFTGIIVYILISKLFKLEAYNETMIILNRLKSKFIKSK